MLVKIVLARACRWIVPKFVIVPFLLICLSLQADDVPLAWISSSTPSVTGYGVFYGPSSGYYTSYVDAGSNTFADITGLTAGTTYYFAVAAYDADGDQSELSSEISFTPGGFQIVGSPLSQNAVAGTNVVLSVSVASTDAVTYQWYENGVAIAGATGATLSLGGVSDQNSGNYNVVVTDGSTSVTSSVAAVSIVDPPQIWNTVTSRTVTPGATVRIRASVTGGGNMTYQWCQRGTLLAGMSNNPLVLSNVTTANNGRYFLQVQNEAGSTTAPITLLTVANAFTSLAGTYNGLFYQINGTTTNITASTAGFLGNCVVGANGIYTATLSLGGFNYPLSGVFNASGYDSEFVSRAANGLSNLVVGLQLDLSGVSQTIAGTVQNTDPANPWLSTLTAALANNSLPVPAGASLLVIPQITLSAGSPHGFGTLTTTTAGRAILVGVLFDGSQISQSVPISQNGFFPFYCSLYGGSGLLEGWVSLANGAPSGSVTWIRPTGANSPVPTPAGFTNVVNVN